MIAIIPHPGTANFKRDHAKRFNRSFRYAFEARTFINIVNIETPCVFRFVHLGSPKRRNRSSNQRYLLIATDRAIPGKEFAISIDIHDINTKGNIVPAETTAFQLLSSFRQIGNEPFGIGKRIGILELLTILSERVDFYLFRLFYRRDKGHALGLLRSPGTIDHDQFAVLMCMMSGRNRDDLVRTGYSPGM